MRIPTIAELRTAAYILGFDDFVGDIITTTGITDDDLPDEVPDTAFDEYDGNEAKFAATYFPKVAAKLGWEAA